MGTPVSAIAAAPRDGKYAQTLTSAAHVYRLILFITLLKPIGNLCLAWGVKQFPQTLSIDPVPYLSAMLDPFVAAGIALQILWLLARMSLLSVADLSFVLPTTAAGYVLSVLLGKVVLHEHVSAARWTGAVMIALGTVLVASTTRHTTAKRTYSQ